ncbi:MerR family transcriptional regulator [Planctomonas sp. JC2975]|uniref:MerR family transcriptional regulator n=1 Tax=Planctomonas sp. JC2975 TaxID=2729626 RepID=UPI001472D875|nr:MerR family transcriptional regulator [Planctomonas sp. JC2975]NNC10810.1 MerR family transcriptional regulator [Planctomonas sp. JC2975]
MLTIGEFASIGRVSVRMLRHYDQIGLLRPARVDPLTGYRAYAPTQLTALTRIIELKGLGLTLEQVSRVIWGDADDGEVERMLTSAHRELQAAIADAQARLRRVDASLRRIQGETVMPTSQTITADIRSIEPQLVATLTRKAPGFGPVNISPVVGPMFPESAGLLAAAGVDDFGPAIALYEADESGDGTGAIVTAGFVVPSDTAPVDGLDVHTLSGIAQAAVTVHRGEVALIGESWDALITWARDNGYELDGVCREVYWTPGDRPQSEWVTDLVQPVRSAQA